MDVIKGGDKVKNKLKRVISAIMAALTIINVMPISAHAAVASDLPEVMVDNVLLDALAYTGYDVQSQINDGTLFIKYGSSTPSSVLSDISYASSGSTAATGLETNSEGLPDISYMEERGTMCGGYVSYVLFNYLPNVAGIDTSYLVQPQYPLSVGSYREAATQWVANGYAELIYEAPGGTNFSYEGDIPIGSLIIMAGPTGDGTYSEWTAGHVCLYAGYYNGKHFVYHVGNSRGPEISTIEGMQGYAGSDGKSYRFVTAIYAFEPDIYEEKGYIEVNKKDPNGNKLQGAIFSATNSQTGEVYIIGPTDSNGYARSEKIPYGTYVVKETVFPDGFTSSGTTSWTVTVNKSQNGLVTINAVNKLKTGYIDIIKTDEDTGSTLKGAVYGIYSDSSCTKLVEKMTTDANGYAKSNALTIGTYYVKEITAPTGYVISKKVTTAVVKSDETTHVKPTDKEQMASLTIYKEGEVLTGWNGSNFVYETKKLQGVTFMVKAGADIYKSDGTKVYNKGDIVASDLKTGSDGKVVLSNLHLGTYVVTETASIDGYTLNTESKTVEIKYKDQTVNVEYASTTVKNVKQKATVSVEKIDDDTKNGLFGGKYTIYAGSDIKNYEGKVIVSKGTALQTVTTDSNGNATYSIDLPIANSYYITETQAPNGYVRNSDEVYEFEFDYLSDDTESTSFSHTFSNERVTAKISLSKVDKETTEAQGDATLDGAVYGLYARNDIVHPDGVTGAIHKADSLVAMLTTDENGQAEILDLYLGDYYVKELIAPEGYVIDENEYDLICNYEGDLIAEVSRSAVSKEQVIKQPFQLIKIAYSCGDTEGELLESAGFTAYLKSSLYVNENGEYDFDSAEPVVIGENGETILYTDENGYLQTIALPYGTYVVRESVTPHNLKSIKPFEVVISENNPDTPQIWRVFMDREFSAKLRIIKKDADRGTTVLVPNAEFKIFNMDTDEYVSMITTYPSKVEHTSFFTDEDGDLILPTALAVGNYRIEEVSAPYGYMVNDNYIYISVDTDTAYEIDADTNDAIITIDYEDKPVEGELSVEKRGEVLTGYVDGEFIYEERGLAGAEFDVYAAENIYTPDNQLDTDGNRIKLYGKGDKVATLVTDETGTATLKNLPLGTYEVIEANAPDGYVLNEKPQTASLVYVDDTTEVVYETIVFSNERQKVELNVIKLDKETEKALSGAVFGIYNAEDIVDADGNIIMNAGTLIESATSDNEGKVMFTKDYPLGLYEVREIETLAGYITNDNVLIFDARYQGQSVEVVKLSENFYNTPTTFEFSKTDITSGVEIAGATLEVIDSDGNVVDSWQSVAGESHVIKKLVVGGTYTLRETIAPYGYLIANEIEFTVEDTDKIQSVVMKDEVPTGSIIVNKYGEVLEAFKDSEFKYALTRIKGVTFEVYAACDIVSADGLGEVYYLTDELVATIETDENGVASLCNLPLGKYYLIETATADGYVINTERIEVDLSYIDQNTEVVSKEINVINDRQKISVSVIKKSAEDNSVLPGATFGLYATDDIINCNGEVIIEADMLIEEVVSGDDGYACFMSDLPLGNYYVKELKAPEGYVLSDEIFEVDGNYQGDSIEAIKVEYVITNTPDKPDEPYVPPKTGDTRKPWIYVGMAALSLIGLAGLSIDKKRKKNN